MTRTKANICIHKLGRLMYVILQVWNPLREFSLLFKILPKQLVLTHWQLNLLWLISSNLDLHIDLLKMSNNRNNNKHKVYWFNHCKLCITDGHFVVSKKKRKTYNKEVYTNIMTLMKILKVTLRNYSLIMKMYWILMEQRMPTLWRKIMQVLNRFMNRLPQIISRNICYKRKIVLLILFIEVVNW